MEDDLEFLNSNNLCCMEILLMEKIVKKKEKENTYYTVCSNIKINISHRVKGRKCSKIHQKYMYLENKCVQHFQSSR